MVERALLTCALAAACLAMAADPARAATWVEVESPHFTVLSDAGERRARDAAWQFEQIRGAIRRLWPWATTDFPQDVVVYAARDERSMRALVPEYFEGRSAIRPDSVFASSQLGHFVAIRGDVRLDSRGDVNPYRSSYWSYMALVIRTSFGRDLPLWYLRGLAEVFSNTVVREHELLVGQLVPWHLERLRGLGRPSLEAIMAADANSAFMRDGERMAEFDASAWGLLHYLIFGNKGQNLVRMNELSYAVRQGADPNEALPRVYGGLQAVKEGMTRYIDQALYVYQKIPADVQVDRKAFQARELSEADAALALARLHAAMGRPVEARAQIAAASGAPAAGEIEGFLLEREDKPKEARAAYARASDAASASFFGEYRLATLSWPEEDGDDARPRLAAIEKGLRRAVASHPRFAPAHSLLAEALVRLDRPEEALTFAQQAIPLAPFESFGHSALARAYWALGRREEAVASAKRALAHADQPVTQKSAQELLDFYTRPRH